MRALAYRVTKHTIPNWIPFHLKEPRGIAYETDSHSCMSLEETVGSG